MDEHGDDVIRPSRIFSGGGGKLVSTEGYVHKESNFSALPN